jgi:hypothetical protein
VAGDGRHHRAESLPVLVLEDDPVAAIARIGGSQALAARSSISPLSSTSRSSRGHFTVRRLERAYGADQVRAEYDRIKSEIAPA